MTTLKLAEIEDVTPGADYLESEDDQKALDKARSRRSAFNFAMVKIPVGSKLEFIRDSNITCEVISSRKVAFEGEQTSLSAAAQKALQNAGLSWKAVQGPMYWKYEDETLGERRYRMETED